MGSGIFAGMPLQLSGTRRLLELMDWGDEEIKGVGAEGGGGRGEDREEEAGLLSNRISLGAVGGCVDECGGLNRLVCEGVLKGQFTSVFVNECGG